MFRLAAALATLAGVAYVALRRSDIPYAELERRYAGPTSRFLRLGDGHTVHVRDDGQADGPVLVLLHGYAASSLDWQPWVERLVGAYRIVSIDLPGHGLTSVPPGASITIDGLVDLVAAVLAQLGLYRVVLAGNSMGGQIAYRLSRQNPERLAGLVLINPLGSLRRPPTRSVPLFRLLATGLGRALMRTIDLTPLVRRSLGTALHERRLVTPALVRRYTDLARAPGHRDILTTLQIGAEPEPVTTSSVTVPTLIMIGDSDQLVAPAESRRLAQQIPGATVIVYPGVGHVPMQQIPDRSARDLDTWMSGHSGHAPVTRTDPARSRRPSGPRKGKAAQDRR